MSLPLDVFYACVVDVDFVVWREGGEKSQALKDEKVEDIRQQARERALAKTSTLAGWWVK